MFKGSEMEIKLPDLNSRMRRRFEKYGVWHRWFAWYPIRFDDATVIWLKPLMRKFIFDSFGYDHLYSKYRRINDPEVKVGKHYP